MQIVLGVATILSSVLLQEVMLQNVLHWFPMQQVTQVKPLYNGHRATKKLRYEKIVLANSITNYLVSIIT